MNKPSQRPAMQMLLSATTILVLFAWAQEQVGTLAPNWSPFDLAITGTQD